MNENRLKELHYIVNLYDDNISFKQFKFHMLDKIAGNYNYNNCLDCIKNTINLHRQFLKSYEEIERCYKEINKNHEHYAVDIKFSLNDDQIKHREDVKKRLMIAELIFYNPGCFEKINTEITLEMLQQ
jgi:hypothetical protein